MRTAAGILLLIAALTNLVIAIGAFAVLGPAEDAESKLVSRIGDPTLEVTVRGERRTTTFGEIVSDAKTTLVVIGVIAAAIALAQLAGAVQSFRDRTGAFVLGVGALSLGLVVAALVSFLGWSVLLLPDLFGGVFAMLAGYGMLRGARRVPAR